MPEIKDYGTITPAAGDWVACQTAAGTTSKATPVGIRDGGAAYGHMYYSNATGTAVNLNVQNTWYGVTFLTAGELQDVTAHAADATADHLTITTAGTYRLTFTCSAYPSAAGTYEIGIHVNGTACSRGGIAIVSPSVTDGISEAGHSVISLAAGAEVSVRVRCTSAASKSVTVRVVSLSVERVGA